MKGAERGFLLLTSQLGDPARRPLTAPQLRTLADRAWQLDLRDPERPLTVQDLQGLGYGPEMARRIVDLLSAEELLEHYLLRARRQECYPLTRVSDGYPMAVRRALGPDSPGVLWAKGDLNLLNSPAVALVGSREIAQSNREFAREAGRQAALQGFALVSGNARGADRIAQEACLAHGGRVIIVAADALTDHHPQEGVLVLSEEDFDQGFSTQRALRRNRVIHALGSLTLVAQCGLAAGGTWNGTVKNLRWGYSPVFCFADGSKAVEKLEELGAMGISLTDLEDFFQLLPPISPII